MATVILTALILRWTTLRFVEEAIGDQMIVQARITAHLLAIGQEKSMTPEEISAHLKEIARFALADFDHSGCTEEPEDIMGLLLPEDLRRKTVRLKDLVDS